MQGPGENAGAVDIGDGLCVVFKIESHNHPSFIEPYQGAATGVGGIIRDIFTMGARPIALLNALRFGSLDTALARRIFEGVVAGVGGYGNSIGIPTVGGEIVFDEMYAGNPLVNVLCLGIARIDEHRQGRGERRGQPGVLCRREDRARRHPRRDDGVGRVRREVGGEAPGGAGRRSVHGEAPDGGVPRGDEDRRGASASRTWARPGLSCATSEMGSRGGVGMTIDVMHVPQRETGMTPYEIMLSESQERMLLVVEKGREHEVEAVFEKWDLHAVQVGEVTEGDRA